MESFGARLKRLRELKELSLKEVASRAGIPVTTYREWEYGREIKGQPYVKIAQALEVTLHELLTGENGHPDEVYETIREMERCCKELRKKLESFL